MKIVFSLLVLIIFNKACADHKIGDSTQTTSSSENTPIAIQEITQISYEATTRGFYEKIWITKGSITVTNDRNQTEKVSRPTLQKDWNDLMTILNGVDIESLPDLEAPTSMRQYDGAAIATLEITQGSDEIKSNNFDHGHPPKSIETLVNKVLSMNDMAEKH